MNEVVTGIVLIFSWLLL